MSNIAIKRLNRDLSVLEKDPLYSMGIYHYVNEENIFNIKAMIRGPEDTPYRQGYYFFDMNFPKEYPFKPPKVSYETRYGNIRFNPNLYTCGKVCVSILGTWSGPQWTSCQSIKSVLISLQTLLHENPLHNEPGYEKEIGEKNKLYNEVIQHENINVAIIRMLRSVTPGFEFFLPVMRELFIKD